MRRSALCAASAAVGVYNYMTIYALEDGLRAKLSSNTVLYSIDEGETWTILSSNTYTPRVNSGQTIMFKGYLTPNGSNGIGTFTISKKCNLMGNCNSLLFGEDPVNNNSLSGKNYAFYKLFSGCTTIVEVSSTFLPANILSEHCYDTMFYGCTSLTVAPELPATTLTYGCYNSMFRNCVGLSIAPKLPATTLVTRCYCDMFHSCNKLSYIEAYFTTNPSTFYTSNWVLYAASHGTFVKNKNATWNVTGVNGIPSSWTVRLA